MCDFEERDADADNDLFETSYHDRAIYEKQQWEGKKSVMKKVKVGLLGIGNVATGTYKTLQLNKEKIKESTGVDIEITKILNRRPNVDRGIDVDPSIYVQDVDLVLNDDDIDIVVELIGGIEPATEYMARALKNGKHVVTANKAAIAANGPELQKLAQENNVMLRFEASVAGGIPIINALTTALLSNEFDEILGIVNGTTNYILTQMSDNGSDYDAVLKDAQEKGFAERDPSGDVEGHDVANKLSILISLIFGVRIKPEDIPTQGITAINKEDISYANQFGCRIKLIAAAKKTDGKLECNVQPAFVPADHPLASVSNEFNAIFVKGNAGYRAGIHMKAYKEKKPIMVIGGRAGSYTVMLTALEVLGEAGLIRREDGLVDLHAAQTLEPAQDLFPVLRHGDQPHMIHFHDSHQPFTTFSTINSAACSRWLRAACFMVWHSWAAWSSTCCFRWAAWASAWAIIWRAWASALLRASSSVRWAARWAACSFCLLSAVAASLRCLASCSVCVTFSMASTDTIFTTFASRLFFRGKLLIIHILLDISEKCKSYFLKVLGSLDTERFCAIFLSKSDKIIMRKVYTDDNENSVSVDTIPFVKSLVNPKISAVVIAHNHPSGNPSPSRADDLATEKLAMLFALNGVKLYDHVIVGGNEVYSYRMDERLEKILNSANRRFEGL